MNWYIAKLIYRIECGNGAHEAQFDEQFRLLEAVDEKGAFAKANEIAILGEDEFLNEKKESIRWKFQAITELNPIEKPAHGVEIYSRIKESGADTGYSDRIRMKEEMLKKRLEISEEKLA
jgi:hypothetical protein